MALFEDNFLDDPENQELLESAKLIIGLHPDEATERYFMLLKSFLLFF